MDAKRFKQLLECQHGIMYNDDTPIMQKNQMDVVKNFPNTQNNSDDFLTKIYAKNKESIARYKDLVRYSRELEKRITDLESNIVNDNEKSVKNTYDINSLRTDAMKNYML